MADQVRRGVAWVYNNAKSFGGDPSRIYVSGQSSGAHLAGCVVTTDWKDYGVPNDIVKGALLCSGMYDLKPVRLSKRSDYVAFTDESEEKLSSQRRLDRLNCPVIVVLRHLRDAGVSAAEPRVRRSREEGRQAGHACWSARATITSRWPR